MGLRKNFSCVSNYQINFAATVIFRCSLQIVAFTVPKSVFTGPVFGAANIV